jgi:hypothetical protein
MTYTEPRRSGAGFLILLGVVLGVAVWPFFQVFIVAAIAVGLGAAVTMRRWNTGHPSTLPNPSSTRRPEINLSAIPVGGDAAGLIFAVGSVIVVLVGVPGMTWYFVSALGCAALFAWALSAWRLAQPPMPVRPTVLGLR